jgi:photosystem II stability/assembly factor-like uncharacterized protein
MADAKGAPPAPAIASVTRSAQVEANKTLAKSPQIAQSAIAGFAAVPTAGRPRFRINNAGQIERSVQPGIWTPSVIAPGTHFRVVSISGSDIWAGADHLRLFHSTDNGLTWTEVQLPSNADRTGAIVHIRIDDPQHITVQDDTGSTWTTIDAGAAWQ